jgi:rRNA maturation RNase YbeY
LSIFFHKEELELEIEENKISSWVCIVIEKLGYKPGDISLIFCKDNYLKEINLQYLHHDYFTDIITFDYTNQKVISGDLFISIDRVKENAKDNNVAFLNELYRVIIHGILHLCGYNDKTVSEKTIIREKENEFVSLIC